MGTQFYCPAAPSKKVASPCDFPGCSEEDRCGYCTDGIQTDIVSEDPEFHLNMGNSFSLLTVLGLYDPEEPCGCVEHEDIPALRRTILKATNIPQMRSAGLREGEDYTHPTKTSIVTSEDGIPTFKQTGGGRVIGGGLDDDGILYRLGLFDTLLVYAQKNGYSVAWG